jgi:8-oxo-dGTP diphosphatase
MKIVTAGVLRNEDGRVLLVRRAPGQKLAGKWEFPGGKVEEGESLSECLKRELHEELGIEVRVGDIIATSDYAYEHGSIRLVAMHVAWLAGDLQLRVHDRQVWLRPEEMLSIDLAPADIPLVASLEEAR